MKVFISWSGDESRQIAEAIRDWLPMAVHAARPYMSAVDNQAGTRWADVVGGELSTTDFGLVCLTPDNLKAPWINFEAGALSKAVTTARVVPLLHRIDASNVASPLSQFMMKPLNHDGVFETVSSLNQALPQDTHIGDVVLRGSFEALWPNLEKILANVKAPEREERVETKRSDREILDEILGLLREDSYGPPRRSTPRWSSPNITPFLDRARRLAGPNGMVEVAGSDVILTRPGLNQMSDEDQQGLLALILEAAKVGLNFRLENRA